MIPKTKVEELYEKLQDSHTLEDILEIFDIDVIQALEVLFSEGLIDEELLERYL